MQSSLGKQRQAELSGQISRPVRATQTLSQKEERLERKKKEKVTACTETYQTKPIISWVEVAHAFSPSTHEAKTGGSLSLRSAWSIRSTRTGTKATEKPCPEKQNKNHYC